MDEFAWSREDALKFMSILMFCGITCNTAVVSILKPLCRRFDERSVLIIGLVLTALAQYLSIPWGGETLQLAITDETSNSTALGCPVDKQPWCATAPAMTVTQLVIAFIAASFGCGIEVTLCQTIFSKVLGPRPQGVWLGVIMSLSSLSRVISPIIISSIYVRLGPVWTFSLTAGITTLCCIWLYLVRARLVPPRAADEGTRQDEELQKLWTHDSQIEIVEKNKEKQYSVVAST